MIGEGNVPYPAGNFHGDGGGLAGLFLGRIVGRVVVLIDYQKTAQIDPRDYRAAKPCRARLPGVLEHLVLYGVSVVLAGQPLIIT